MGKTKQKPILIHLPKPWIVDLDLLVKTGMYPNRAEAIRVAVRDLLESEVWEGIEKVLSIILFLLVKTSATINTIKNNLFGGERREREEKARRFFSANCNSVGSNVRVLLSVVRNLFLRGPLDNWKWYLTLAGLSVFFVLGLPLPYIYLCFKHQTYAYLWLGFWVAATMLMLNREMVRRDKPLMGSKWFNNPNAVKEYIELLKDR